MKNSELSLIDRYSKDQLIWLPEKGMGYYPVKPSDMPYNEEYFKRYQRQADTDIGRELVKARVEMVKRHWSGSVIDVGIGCGNFVLGHGNAKGSDVNPIAIQWLKKRGLYADPYNGCASLCFWDSLEHIFDIEEIVSKAYKFVFVSIPIFESAEHCMRSKHFRRDEHVWYFTDAGLKAWFSEQGFACVEENDMETVIGREDIKSYAFKRVSMQ